MSDDIQLYSDLYEELKRLSVSSKPDSSRKAGEHLRLATESLLNQDSTLRPGNSDNVPGGLLHLNREKPLLILPDLHARRDFLFAVLNMDFNGGLLFDALIRDDLQLLCVGDGFHSEKRAYKRWLAAMEEYKGNFRRHRQMDREMTESLGLMQMVMLLQSAFPANFFFLKGNHENILNEEGRGNHPFGKFVYEGEMVRFWTEKFMGEDFLERYALYEHLLPFMALGESLIITHAEPREYYSPSEIIDISRYDHIKLGLTWTANDQAEDGSVERLLENYSHIYGRTFSHCIGGHRTINGLFQLRANGSYVQIHNPDRYILAFSDQRSDFDPNYNIIDIQEQRSLSL